MKAILFDPSIYRHLNPDVYHGSRVSSTAKLSAVLLIMFGQRLARVSLHTSGVRLSNHSKERQISQTEQIINIVCRTSHLSGNEAQAAFPVMANQLFRRQLKSVFAEMKKFSVV